MGCEICGADLPLNQLVECDRCGALVCQDCSDYVEGQPYNHEAYEILCIDCIAELMEE